MFPSHDDPPRTIPREGLARGGWLLPSLMTAGALLLTWAAPSAAFGAEEGLHGWIARVKAQFTTPLFWFGIVAQAMFFMRFLYQWIVSERRRRSTIPTAFWYFSLIGGSLTFVYACLRGDPVFMLGQLAANFIYVRNLMLIHGRASRRRRAGLPAEAMGDGGASLAGENDLPD